MHQDSQLMRANANGSLSRNKVQLMLNLRAGSALDIEIESYTINLNKSI
jgi:hypothetical protein